MINQSRESCCIKACCLDIAIAIVAALFAFGLGLLLGALFAVVLFFALPALIVFVAVMFIIGLILVLLRRCRRDRDDCGCFGGR